MKTKTTNSWYDIIYPNGQKGKVFASSRNAAYIKGFKKLTNEEKRKVITDSENNR